MLREEVKLNYYPASGVLKPPANTLEITFETETLIGSPVAGYSWDFEGDGIIDLTGIDPASTHSYNAPGFYFPKVLVMDLQGNRFEESTVVHVVEKEEAESILRSKWEGMRTALVGGDIEGALQFFVAASRDRYRQVFSDLGSERITFLFSNIVEFKLFTLYGKAAGAGAVRMESGRRYAYPVNFVKDEKGMWKISGL
jgi:hypothetical protein